MSSDLIERLLARRRTLFGKLFVEAADEIERLRTRLVVGPSREEIARAVCIATGDDFDSFGAFWVETPCAEAADAILGLLDSETVFCEREQGPPCPNCLKPVEVGQVVLPWDDAGEMHADCIHPFSLKYDRQEDEPEPVILLGEPMCYVPLLALLETKAVEGEGR